VLYLFLEVAFRSRLLDVTSSVSDGLTIEALEITGRLIASLGFSVLVSSKLNLGQRNIESRIVHNAAAFALLFFVCFHTQKQIVDYAVSQISEDFKKNAILLSVFKENLFFNKENIKGVTDGDALPTSNEKIFLATLPIVNINNDKYINALTTNQKKLFGNNIVAKIENSDEELAKLEFKLISAQLRSIWTKYKKVTEKKVNQHPEVKKQQKEKAKKLYFSLARKEYYLYEKYKGHTLSLLSSANVDDFINSTFSNDGNFKVIYEEIQSSWHPIADAFIRKVKDKYYPRSTLLNLRENEYIDEDHYNSKTEFINYFRRTLDSEWNHNAESHVNSMYPKAKAFLGLSREKADSILNSHLKELEQIKGTKGSLCYESNNFPEVKQKNDFREVDKLNNNERYGLILVGSNNNKYLHNSYEIGDDSLSKKYLICDTTKIEYKVRKALIRLAVKVNKSFFGFSHDINSYRKYRKTFFGKKDIQKLYRSQDMLVPLGFDSDRKGFEKYYKESLKIKTQRIITSNLASLADMTSSAYLRKHGETSTSLNEVEFYRLPAIQIALDEKFPQMSQSKGYIMMPYRDTVTPKWHMDAISISTRDNIIGDFIENKEKYNGGYLYQVFNDKIEDNKIMDLYAKSIVVPTFVLLVSTIMIIFNIANLIWLSLNTASSKKKSLVLLSTFTLFLALSMLNDNNKYINYYKNLEGDANGSLIILASFLQNTNALFESIGFLNSIINDQIDNFESYAIIDDIEGHDVAKKYRDLQNGIRIYIPW